MRSSRALPLVGLVLAACAPEAPVWTAESRANMRRPANGAARAARPGAGSAVAACGSAGGDSAGQPTGTEPETAAAEHEDDGSRTDPVAVGRVVDEAGRPVAGVRIRVVAGLAGADWTADTCDEGRFDVDASEMTARPPIARTVAWTEDGRAALGPWLAVPAAGRTDWGELRLAPRESFTHPEDAAALDAWARRDPSSAGPPPPADETRDTQAAHDVDGEVWFAGEPVRLVRRAASSCWPRMSGRRIEVFETWTSGTPTVRHLVDSEGRFSFHAERQGAQDVWFHVAEDWEPLADASPADLRVRIDVPGRGLRIELPRAVRQRIVPEVPAECGEAAWLDLVCRPLDRGTDARRSGASGAGLRTLILRPGAKYDLSVRVRCGSRWLAASRIGAFEPSVDPIVLPVSAGATVAGVVVREDGSPVPGALVRIVSGPGPSAAAPLDARATTDAWTTLDGTFLSVGIDPGAASVTASAPGLSGEADVRAPAEDVRVVVAHAPR